MTAPHEIAPGTPVVVGDRLAPMPELEPGDRLIAVQRTGDLLVVPAAEHRMVTEAVAEAERAFRAMAGVSDAQISEGFRAFAERLADDGVWGEIADANAVDVERATAAGRSTTRLAVTEKMRAGMIDGLHGWAKAPSRRGEVIERGEGGDWTVERRRAPLGVIAFVFEGRPNVFADGAGVLRGGNAAVMRIGSDALDTAIAIEERAIRPALRGAGLPEGAITLVRSRAHAAAHTLFTSPEVRLAVARGSGPAVALLGAIAEQHGITASLHGTGGAWLYLADDAPAATVHNAVCHSLDRKVCNTLNTLLIDARRAPDLVACALEALTERDANVRLHVAEGSRAYLPGEVFEARVRVRRPDGEHTEPQADTIPVADLSREWEWEGTPELAIAVVDGQAEAVALTNRYSPRFVAGIITASPERFEDFYERVDAPYVGNAFTRWVDGQWAWGRPELGLTNWEWGRLMGRSGILAGDDVFTVREVFHDRTGEARQRR